jgi:hypothetical protein
MGELEQVQLFRRYCGHGNARILFCVLPIPTYLFPFSTLSAAFCAAHLLHGASAILFLPASDIPFLLSVAAGLIAAGGRPTLLEPESAMADRASCRR